jgi:transcriptional regulator of met regulon
MPRIAKKVPMVRLNLEMAEPVRQQLEQLRDSTHADSLTEVFRQGPRIYFSAD